MSRKIALFFLFAAILVACQIDDEMYTSYDVYYNSAFTTDSTKAVLGSAAKKDSLDTKFDVWLKVKGGFEYVADNVVAYGHCWVKGKEEPVIKSDGSNCKIYDGKPNVKDFFFTQIPNLECETEYSIRSFVIVKDKNGNDIIGYNPETLVVVTDTPHDKWFESEGFVKNGIIAGRSDVLCVSTVLTGSEHNDTLTFFGMGRSGDIVYSDLWCYSSHSKTFEQIPDLKNNAGEVMKLWGAIGFGINYGERDAARRLVYVGCGCARANNYKIDDYNKKFFVYDLDQRNWQQVTYIDGKNQQLTRQPFQGEARTGGIGFSVREWGFVGLGEFETAQGKGAVHYHADFYLFMMDKDAKTGKYTPERGYFNQMTEDFGFGPRSGASVVVVDDNAYIFGGKGSKGYYDELLTCHFSMPTNSRPDSYTFQWPKAESVFHFNDRFGEDYDFKARAFGTAFAVGDNLFYGMGEGVDDDDKLTYYSDMIKIDRTQYFQTAVCAPYKNENIPENSVSRATVIHGGDRVFVIGGAMQGTGDFTTYSNSEWVYRP